VSVSLRTDKELLLATKAFAFDDRYRSWWYLFSTLALYFSMLAVCLTQWHWSIRTFASVISGLLIVRLFIIYHDYQHHAILTKSKIAGAIMYVYGLLVLSPSSVWNRSHDHHHKHNCKETNEHIGSFPVMTCQQFASSTRWQKLSYIFSRHPLTIGCGYLTVFMGGMCLRAVILNPARHFDSLLALILHLTLVVGLAFVGWDYLALCLILPLVVSCGIGSYLFYAQHNFPGCMLDRRDQWSYVRAALASSSYMRMHPIMNWFTGNIGYHHVHHLNAKIPFYRLHDAMESLVELQKPSSTSLHLADIFACFRLNLWDTKLERFVSYREARLSQACAATE
jgi:acyl-lipid omega-6 desaturase (Delta-12 desaturase)